MEWALEDSRPSTSPTPTPGRPTISRRLQPRNHRGRRSHHGSSYSPPRLEPPGRGSVSLFVLSQPKAGTQGASSARRFFHCGAVEPGHGSRNGGGPVSRRNHTAQAGERSQGHTAQVRERGTGFRQELHWLCHDTMASPWQQPWQACSVFGGVGGRPPRRRPAAERRCLREA